MYLAAFDREDLAYIKDLREEERKKEQERLYACVRVLFVCVC